MLILISIWFKCGSIIITSNPAIYRLTIRPFICPFNSLINNSIRLIAIVKFH